MFDTVWTNAHIATMSEDGGHPRSDPYGLKPNSAVAVKDGKIGWIGSSDDAPAAAEVISVKGALITPGLVDCHTHLVFGGNRAAEFEARLGGQSYEQIALAGGGILSTVKATREASEAELTRTARTRLMQMKAEGVTTVEIKSGYGLDLQSEAKMLRAARALENDNVRVRTTCLAAHAHPPEFETSDAYIDHVCEVILPDMAAQNLCDAVDGFCETIGFTPAQIRRVFETANDLDLPIKLHAEQLSNQHGAVLAAKFGALSVDHLEYLGEEDIPALKKAGTVAVMLPGAFYFLKETQKPPIKALRRAGVPMALATDCNPGSSPIQSPLTILNMACTLFGMTPAEALLGMTRNGARALGIESETGSLDIGKSADLAIWDVGQPAELCYWIGGSPLKSRIFKGVPDDR